MSIFHINQTVGIKRKDVDSLTFTSLLPYRIKYWYRNSAGTKHHDWLFWSTSDPTSMIDTTGIVIANMLRDANLTLYPVEIFNDSGNTGSRRLKRHKVGEVFIDDSMWPRKLLADLLPVPDYHDPKFRVGDPSSPNGYSRDHFAWCRAVEKIDAKNTLRQDRLERKEAIRWFREVVEKHMEANSHLYGEFYKDYSDERLLDDRHDQELYQVVQIFWKDVGRQTFQQIAGGIQDAIKRHEGIK